jgi:hypothetical protein
MITVDIAASLRMSMRERKVEPKKHHLFRGISESVGRKVCLWMCLAQALDHSRCHHGMLRHSGSMSVARKIESGPTVTVFDIAENICQGKE